MLHYEKMKKGDCEGELTKVYTSSPIFMMSGRLKEEVSYDLLPDKCTRSWFTCFVPEVVDK